MEQHTRLVPWFMLVKEMSCLNFHQFKESLYLIQIGSISL